MKHPESGNVPKDKETRWGSRMKKNRKKHVLPVLLAVCLLSGCSGVSSGMREARQAGIDLLNSGDYEGAIAQFEQVIEKTGRVTEFELDVLKYRAEAEAGLSDYEAAAHTYEILSQVDQVRAEYCYLGESWRPGRHWTRSLRHLGSRRP